jgi:hypothetical protein
MASLTRTLDIEFTVVAQKIDEILSVINSSLKKKSKFSYETIVKGYIHFSKSSSKYRFDDIGLFKDALVGEDLNDISIFSVDIIVYEKDNKDKYSTRERIIDITFSKNITYGAIDVSVDSIDFIAAKNQIDVMAVILNAEYLKIEELTEAEKAEKLLLEERSSAIRKSIRILENLPDLQTRINTAFKNEKDVQDFLFPILKSHFPELQEEDYLSKFAGTASKPDFGIENLGIAFEIKYISQRKNFKELSKEINDDSRQYFGKKSPFKTMIVLIYNGASKPTPVGFIHDIESVDVISRVIISPRIIP